MRDLPTDADGTLCAYAWPGGYPILYLDSDGSVLCPKCAQESLADTLESFRASAYFIHFEGPAECCEACNALIESSYGDPKEDR